LFDEGIHKLLKWYKKITMIKKNNLEEIFLKALSYHKNNRLKEAEKEYIRLIKLNPKYFKAYNNLGTINERINKNNAAKELFLNAIKLNPNYIDAIYNLGNIYNKLKDYNLAKDYFEKIIKIDPVNEKAYNALGITFYNLQNLTKAKFCFQKIIDINNKNYQAYYNLGKILNEEENHEEAIKLFNQCIKIYPNHSNAYNNLGMAHNKLSLTSQAKNFIEKSIEINPKNFYSYNNLGIVLDNTYNTKEAKENFTKAININPNFIDAWWNLHCCSKNINEALEVLEKLYEIDKNHIKAKIIISALKTYNGNSNDYKSLMSSGDCDHPYARSIDWVLSLKKLPKLFFNKWDFYDSVIDMTKKDRPFYEYGVRLGHSFKYLIKTFKKGYGFDTFTGLPEDWHSSKPKGSYSSFGIVPKIKGGEFIVGKFEDTLAKFFSKKREIASLINFDADLYSSTICSLINSKTIIDEKTILIFDEFLMNSNWEKDEYRALNEFCEKFRYSYEVVAVSFFTKQVAVKII